jgi:hypothetical protein
MFRDGEVKSCTLLTRQGVSAKRLYYCSKKISADRP